jgi:hypothetical protein
MRASTPAALSASSLRSLTLSVNTRPGQQVAAGQVGRNADAALEIEGVGEGGALDEGGEARAGQLFKRLEIVMLADGEADRLRRAISQDGVGELDPALGEIELEHVAEAAGYRPFDPEPGAPQLVRETEPRIADPVRARHVGHVILQAPARLERPAARRRNRRRAAETDLGTGLGRGRLGRRRRLGCGQGCELDLRRLRGGRSQSGGVASRLELGDARLQRLDLRAQRGELGGDISCLLGMSGSGSGEHGSRQQRSAKFADHRSPLDRRRERRQVITGIGRRGDGSASLV